MKFWLGLLMFISGIALGFYIGVWVMFVGGILDLIEAGVTILTEQAVQGWKIGFGILKIMFAGIIGYLSAIALMLPAMVMMEIPTTKRIKRRIR